MHFSIDGSLRSTVRRLVYESAAGFTHRELHELLKVRVHNTLLDLLRKKEIEREQLVRVYVYLHADLAVRNSQLERRREQIASQEAAEGVTDHIVIQVLLTLIRHPGSRAADVVRYLHGHSPPTGQGRENLVVLVHWLIEGDGRKKPPYPFSLPHLDFFHRSGQLTQKLRDWVPLPWSSVERRAIGHLESLVARPWRDERPANAVSRSEKGWEAFCRLRNVLRLTEAELPMGDSCCRQMVIPAIEKERLNEIKKATLKYLDELRERVGDHTKSPDPEAVILKYFNLYGDHLFGHPALRDENGSIMAVVERTNNILEHFFGQQKQSLRRHVGRSNLGRDMEDQPAQVALTSNLRHTDYVRILCGSLDNLPDAFADLGATMLERTTPLHRDNRDSALSRLVRALLDRDDYPGSLPSNEAESARIAALSTVV